MVRSLLHAVVATIVCLWAIPLLVLRKKTRPGLAARLGRVRIDGGSLPKGARIWVHAASAGDVKNIWPLVARLREARADIAVVLSVITNSGAEMARQMKPAPDVTTFLPLDAPPFVGSALDAIEPDVLLLECTELWPALITAAARRDIPVILCNGRVSERSARGYRWLVALVGNFIARLGVLCLQTEEDQARFVRLGAGAERCHVTGNCKFDAAARVPPVEKVAALREALGDPKELIVAGSTHLGEEELVLDAFTGVRKARPGAKLLWAPRYLEHAGDLVQRSKSRGLKVARRSDGSNACTASDVVILDTMGELAAAYALARVAVVGGSFVQRGGQNILEPAAQGVPVLHGPDMRLAPDQAHALDGVGALSVTSSELPSAAARLLVESEEAARMGERGRAVVQALSGAAARHLALILPVIPSSHRGRK